MANPQSLLEDVRGLGRDFAIDGLPRGFVWDLIDYIPNRRGAKLEGRGPWSYHTTGSPLAGTIWGGKHAAFSKGQKLLVWGGNTLYDHPIAAPGTPSSIGTLFTSGLQNGVMLRDRVYFADGQGLAVPKRVSWDGVSAPVIESIHSSAPKAKLVEVYKEYLIAAGDPANPQNLYFSLLESDPSSGPPFGPMAAWDVKSVMGAPRDITALAPMSGQILLFHPKSIGKIRGGIPPSSNTDTDMTQDMFSDQMGCTDPASVCQWQENVIFCNSRGVHLTDGATIRSLSDQGSIGDFWRFVYSRKRSGTQVVAGVFLDFLLVTILTDYTPPGMTHDEPFTFVCDLNERTWFRFANYYPTCYIESELGAEEVWAGLDADLKLMKIGPVFYGNQDIPEGAVPVSPLVDAIDGNTKPVLPLIDLGWKRLGPEGVKRLRHVYVSHQTRLATGNADVLQVDYQTNIGTELLAPSMTTAGLLPTVSEYTRHRLKVGKRGYGIRFIIKQTVPTAVSRLYDVGVEEWAQDRGKL